MIEPASYACPKCKGKFGVTDSRETIFLDTPCIRRRRVCQSCPYRVTTYEISIDQLYEYMSDLQMHIQSFVEHSHLAIAVANKLIPKLPRRRRSLNPQP